MSWFHKELTPIEHDFKIGDRVRYPWMLKNGVDIYSTGIIVYFRGSRVKIKDDYGLAFAEIAHIEIKKLLHIIDGNDILKGLL